MTNTEIQNVLVNILTKMYQENYNKEYTEQISPFTTLGAFISDSLDQVHMILELEKALNIKINDYIAENNFQKGSTIQNMTNTIASLNPRRTSDWYNAKFSNKKVTKIIEQPIIELYELNTTTLQFRQGDKILSLYDKTVKPYMDMLRKELAKQNQ